MIRVFNQHINRFTLPVYIGILGFVWLTHIPYLYATSGTAIDKNGLSENADALINMSFEELMDLTVETASKQTEKISEAPATVIVITKQEIHDRGYSNLNDVFRDLPGMSPTYNQLSEIGTHVGIRGLGSNNFIVVMVNGMRVNPPGNEGMPFRSDFSVRHAERIEVIYGPGATLYGQDAISGVINIITQKPNDNYTAQIMLAGGTNEHKEGFVSLAKRFINQNDRPIDFTFYFQMLDAKLDNFKNSYPTYWDQTTGSADSLGIHSSTDRWDQGFNGFFQLATERNSLQIWHRESSRNSAEGGTMPILYSHEKGKWHDRSTVIEALNQAHFTENLYLDSSLTFNRYEIDPDSRYFWTGSDATETYDDYLYGLGTSISLEEQLHYDFTDRISAIAGFVVTSKDILPKSAFPRRVDLDKDITSQGDYLTYYTIQGDPDSRVDVPMANNVNYENYGAYMEGTFRLTDGFKLTAGIRIDEDTRYDEVPISPRFAAVYQFDNNIKAKYIYTESYAAPNPYIEYQAYDNGRSLILPAIDLDPETAKYHEINITYTNKKNFYLSSSFFKNRQSDIIVFDETIPANEIGWLDEAGTNFRVLKRAVNSSSNRIYGADLFAKYYTSNMEFWGSYSYIDSQNIVNYPDHIFKAGATYSFTNKLKTTLSGVYRSPPNYTDYFTYTHGLRKCLFDLNLMIRYEMNDMSCVYLKILNLTDNDYALNGLATSTPQESIKAILGLSVKF